MTKQEFLKMLTKLYSVCNMADSDNNPAKPDWVKPDMAGDAGAQHFDRMLKRMLQCGAISADDFDNFYNSEAL